MTTYESFFHKERFERVAGVFVQKTLPPTVFEEAYLPLRKREGRLLDDDTARGLPHIPSTHPHAREWKMRQKSASGLVSDIRKGRPTTLMEVGCGNGWLTRYLHRHLQISILGVDLGGLELQQAARLDDGSNTFARVDIFSGALDAISVDVVVLAASIQYFSDLDAVVERLLKMINLGGSIHIIDSPFYSGSAVTSARLRSKSYFESQGVPTMVDHYFHHSLSRLTVYDAEIKYDPTDTWSRVQQKLGWRAPLYWVKIRKKG